MAPAADKSAWLILLIPTAIVAVGLAWALTTGDVRVIAAMLLIAGAMAVGFVRARAGRRNSAAHSR